jgi:uncharacterized protein (DUF362 family)/ferredoxin
MTAPATVALAKCSTYEQGLTSALSRLLSEIGGVGAFVSPGQKVLVKPNLLTDRTPAEAVTTHPEVVRAIVRLLRKSGADPFVADSPASSARLRRVWDRTGFGAMCTEEDVPLVNLEKTGSVRVNANGRSFNVARAVLDADAIINVPKLKTHVLTVLTCAVKNMYGAIPGYQKTNLHKRHPKPFEFGRLVTDVYTQVRPVLNIADAVVGMEGDGPSGGKPVELGFLAASADGFALDLTMCRILRIKPASVPYLSPVVGSGAGAGVGRITLRGADVADITPRSFALPGRLPLHLLPRWAVKLADPLLWIRPVISDTCLVCGRCVEACPTVSLVIGNEQKPVLVPETCIGCCCCHEVCPENAVEMKQSPLLNFLRRGKMP